MTTPYSQHAADYLTRNPACTQCSAPSAAVALCPDHHRAWAASRAGRN